MKAVINVELQDINGQLWRFDGASEDTPLVEWLLDTVPRLGPEFNNLRNNATIRIWVKD